MRFFFGIKMIYICVATILVFIFLIFNFPSVVYYLNHWFGGEYAISSNKREINNIGKYNLFNYLKTKFYDIDAPSSDPILTPQSLPVYDAENFNIDEAVKTSNQFRKPFIVRGLIKNHKCYKEWNLDYFENNYGDMEVPALKNGADILDSKNTFHTIKEIEMIKFKDHINKIKKGEKSYINNSSSIFYKRPEVLNDLEYEKIEKLFSHQQKLKSRIKHLFFGPKNTGSALHCAFVCNIFFNVYGRKKWVFIDPKYSRKLKSVPSVDGVFSISPLDAFDENPDNQYLKIPRYENTLEPGDVLFVAGWWWHAVKNISDYTIAVANRTSMPMKIIKNNKLFSTIFFSHPDIIYKRFLHPYLISKNEEELCKNSNKAIEENHVKNITSNYDK